MKNVEVPFYQTFPVPASIYEDFHTVPFSHPAKQ